MELSSSSQNQNLAAAAADPNPQYPYPNPNPKQEYCYPPPLNPNNPNPPIDQQVQPPGTGINPPYYPLDQNYAAHHQTTDASFLLPYSYYQDSNALFSTPLQHAPYLAVNPLTPGVAIGAYPINPLQSGSNWKNASKKPKVVQSVWCEICNLECNTKDVLEVHKTGKKHNKNLSKLKESASNVPASAPTPVSAPVASKKPKIVHSVWCEICNLECNTKDVLEVHKTGKKHNKNLSKLKESASNVPASTPTSKKTKVVQFIWCEICNLECNTKDVLEVHKKGKKHIKNLSKLKESTSNVSISVPSPVLAPSGIPSPASAPTPVSAPFGTPGPTPGFAPTPVSLPSDILGPSPASPTPVSAPFGTPEPSPISAPTPVSPSSEIPGPSPASAPTPVSSPSEIPGTSPASAPTPLSAPFGTPEPSPVSAPTAVSEPFEIPVPSLSPAPSVSPSTSHHPVIGPQENPNTSSATNAKKKRKKGGEPGEDLATKTRKLLEGGAAPAAVHACQVCNVVCNSDRVYKFHLAGQKHATMMKKNAVLTGGAVVI